VKGNEELKQHKNDDSCLVNYYGLSGGMEVAGALAIFACSVPLPPK
jgi:hypothetical protein